MDFPRLPARRHVRGDPSPASPAKGGCVTPTANGKRDFYADPNRKPAVLAVDADGIPDELKALPQWVTWRLTWKRDKWDKPPVNPHNGNNASSTDPATWA